MFLRTCAIGLALLAGMSGINASKLVAQEKIWAVTQNQFLISWHSDAPSVVLSGTAISGLQQNEQILGIDFRPGSQAMYAIGSSNRLYTINTSNGAATQVGPAFGIFLNGSAFGYDFNPTVDLSRIDTNANKNYVVNPNDGSIVQATDLAYQAGDPNFGIDPNVSHIAYTNSYAGAGSTQLFAIDTGLDILTTQANSAGTLNTVGSLGFDITELGGFDITGSSNIAYGSFQLTSSTNSQFFSVDLLTGQLTLIGEIAGGTVITAMTIDPIPEPSVILALFACAPILAIRRNRRG